MNKPEYARLATIVDHLKEHGERSITFYAKNQVERISFLQLYTAIVAAVPLALEQGIVPGSRVGLVAENGYQALLADLVLLRLGCTVIQLPEGSARETAGMVGANRFDFLMIAPGFVNGMALEQFTAAGKFSSLMLYRKRAGCDGEHALDGVPALIFSSGTSGKIKKIKVGDEAVMYNAKVFFSSFAHAEDEIFLIFLPLSNFQQKLLIYGCILSNVNFCLTDTRHVLAALKAIRPTLFLAPPIFYETAWKLAGPSDPAALAACFGGRMRMMWSGMAPIAPPILEGYQSAGLPLLEAYGMTEYGPITANLPGANVIGSVGRPLVKGSVSLSPEGEILVRSPRPLTTGYLDERPEDETEVYRDAQTVATGDLGYFDSHGHLFLQGRKKELILTSSGHKVHPNLVEREFTTLPFVTHAVLMGDRRPYLGLLVMLASRDEAQEALLNQKIRELNAGCCKSSPIKKCLFLVGQFSPDEGLMTRNLKLHRGNISKKYEQHVFA